MNTNIKYILVGAVILLVAFFAWWFNQNQDDKNGDASKFSGVKGDPIDITLDFYEAWLKASRSTSTNPFPEVVNNSQALNGALREKLLTAIDSQETDAVDPVLCQTFTPEKIRSKTVYEKDDSMQLMILSKNSENGGQAIVTLKSQDNLWEISDIECVFGESASPQGEFSFDKEGQLLKSVPPPLNPDYWHLVFEENGAFGHTVPLLLDENSQCIKDDGSSSVCSEDMLTQTATVRVQGDMAEAGLQVKLIEF